MSKIFFLIFVWIAATSSLPQPQNQKPNADMIVTFVPNTYERFKARDSKTFDFQKVTGNSPSDSSKAHKHPFSPPTTKFRIGVVTDLDEKAIVKSDKVGEAPKSWDAKILEGTLAIQFDQTHPNLSAVEVEWDKKRVYKLRSGYSYGSRGMELSTLNVFNGNVYTCDDKTGIVFELPLGDLLDLAPIPWAILADGNFSSPKGFKCEWATVKNKHLWIGGHGVTTMSKAKDGAVNYNQKFVKKISSTGEVTHLDWRPNFDKMADALDIKFPGYVTHESAGWSDIKKKWMFMPRRISKTAYSDEGDSVAGNNVVLIADEDFKNVAVSKVGDLVPTHGFSSFKWVPGTGDQIVVALKTVEEGDKTESYIMAFTLDGTILLKETKFSDEKFEGIEFL